MRKALKELQENRNLAITKDDKDNYPNINKNRLLLQFVRYETPCQYKYIPKFRCKECLTCIQ